MRRRSDPEESTNRRYFSNLSKFIDGVRSDDLRTMLATYYKISKDKAPTPEKMRQKSREYMLMKPKSTHTQKAGTCKEGASHKGRHGTNLETSWTNVGYAQIVDERIIMWRILRPTSRA